MTTNQHNQNQKPKKTGKIIALVLAIIFITGTISGLFLFKKYQDKKIAKDYINQEAENFSEIVELVNDLSTERFRDSIKDHDQNEKTIQEIEEEMNKLKKAIDRNEKGKKENADRKIGGEIEDLDELFKDFYGDLEKALNDYYSFVNYDLETEKYSVEHLEKDKQLKESGEPTTLVEKGKRIKKELELRRELEDNYAKVETTVGFEDYINGQKEESKEYFEIMEKMAEVAENDDQEAFDKITETEFVSFYIRAQRSAKTREKIMEHSFESLHDNFADANDIAVEIEEELIKKGSELGIQNSLPDITIKNW